MKIKQRKYRWIAMDEDGEWYAYVNKPKLFASEGLWSDDDYAALSNLANIAFIGFVRPPCDDWTQSLTEICDEESVDLIKWTRERPTTAGQYLLKQDGYWPVIKSTVEQGDWKSRQNPEWLYALRVSSSDVVPVSTIDGWWFGPVPCPPKY